MFGRGGKVEDMVLPGVAACGGGLGSHAQRESHARFKQRPGSSPKALYCPFLVVPKLTSKRKGEHITSGLLQAGVGSRSDCASGIHRGQRPDAGAYIREEHRS
jgi:hypothetical protein